MRGVANSLRMRIRLQTTRSRWLFLLLLLCISGSLAFPAAGVWITEHWNSTSDPQLWLRAAKAEPGNAEYWDHLGRYELLDFTGNLSQALEYLKRAARVNPRSDAIWTDLASAYEASGKPSEALRAYAQAQADHPISASVAWRYGNFLVRQGRNSEGFAEIRRAITSDPSLTEAAVSECWEASGNAEALLDQVLPEKSSYYVTALNFFLSRSNLDAALRVWSRLLRLGQPFPMEPALGLTDELITSNRVADAEKTWQETLAAEHWPQSPDRGDNLIFNGGFEHRPAGGGFDWREQPVAGVSYALDQAVAHSGMRSMRITFDGSANLNFSQLTEYVAVEPKKHYHFSAYLRTQGITTDSGVRFAIDDVRHPSEVHVLTANLVGSHPWALVEADIATGADTDLLALSLRRLPSQKFDNKLAGNVWVDDVSLVPAESDRAEARQR
jgi:hypothetical protein